MITDEEIEQACLREFGSSGSKLEVALYIARWTEKMLLIRMCRDAIVEKHEKVISDIDNMLNHMTR